ncbi:MAG TPA: hypothetical protein VF399_00005, partial [bacterium]
DTDDAYCRVHNLTGKKSANCGQPALPASAGPWVRMDGFPFGGPIDNILSPNGIVYVLTFRTSFIEIMVTTSFNRNSETV